MVAGRRCRPWGGPLRRIAPASCREHTIDHGVPTIPSPDAVLVDVFRAYPQSARPLLGCHQSLLRGPFALTVAERELIAAYVSGLNVCRCYCHGVHQATAHAFGIGEGTVAARLTDVDTAHAGLLAGMARCRLAWWASSGAIGEPGAAG